MVVVVMRKNGRPRKKKSYKKMVGPLIVNVDGDDEIILLVKKQEERVSLSLLPNAKISLAFDFGK